VRKKVIREKNVTRLDVADSMVNSVGLPLVNRNVINKSKSQNVCQILSDLL